jgi:hypothetical protein
LISIALEVGKMGEIVKIAYLGWCLIAALPLIGQTAVPANPGPGCSATPEELAANKKVVLEFFRPGADRVALADPSYIQHNPAFKKRAEEKKITDYEEFKVTFTARAQRGGRGRGAAEGPHRGARQVLRSIYVRHVPCQERQISRALGQRCDSCVRGWQPLMF